MIDLRQYVAGGPGKGFTLAECCASDTADRAGIDNTPPASLIPTIADTAKGVLMPAREHFNIPFSPTSGFRSYALERILCANAIAAAVERAYTENKRLPIGQRQMDIDVREAAEAAYLARKQHPKGNAFDIKIPGVSIIALGKWFAGSAVDFDQVIFEMFDPRNPAKGWVHVSKVAGVGKGRRDVLWTLDGSTYQKGIPDG